MRIDQGNDNARVTAKVGGGAVKRELTILSPEVKLIALGATTKAVKPTLVEIDREMTRV
jgi:hypothetical protein